jgi:hypothetical protein
LCGFSLGTALGVALSFEIVFVLEAGVASFGAIVCRFVWLLQKKRDALYPAIRLQKPQPLGPFFPGAWQEKRNKVT